MAPRRFIAPVGPSGSIGPNQQPINSQQQPYLDSEGIEDIDYYRRRAANQLAEYAQRLAVANADADFERRGINRDIGISQEYGRRASDLANASYAELMAELQSIVPQTQEAYNAGVTGVSNAYQQGINLAQAPQEQAQSLEAQLAAMTGGQTDNLQGQITSPTNELAALLQAGIGSATGNLSTLGQGDVAASHAAIPGYDVERQRRVDDIGLDVNAQLSELRNDLAGVHSQFIPFNHEALQLETDRAIQQAVRQSLSRREEAEDKIYSGNRGVQQVARDLGRPDLVDDFFQLRNLAEQQQELRLDNGAVQSAPPPEVALRRAIEAYAIDVPERYERRNVTVRENTLGDDLAQTNLDIIPGSRQAADFIGGLFGRRGGERQENRNVRIPESPQERRRREAQQQRDIEALQALYDAYYGNY